MSLGAITGPSAWSKDWRQELGTLRAGAGQAMTGHRRSLAGGVGHGICGSPPQHFHFLGVPGTQQAHHICSMN